MALTLARHHYARNAEESGRGAGALPALRRALMREFKALRGGQLPLHPDAAILLRHGEGRMDAMRAVLRCAFGLGLAHPHPKPNQVYYTLTLSLSLARFTTRS